MLDRRSLPEPPKAARSLEGDIYWVDAAGKVWRYVPLEQQLRELYEAARSQARNIAGMCITSASILSVVGGIIAMLAIGTERLAVLALPIVVVVGVAILGSVYGFARNLVLWEQEYRQRLRKRCLLPALLDAELAALQHQRLTEVFPSPLNAVDRPDRVALQVRTAALHLPALLACDGHVERLGFLAVSSGVIASKSERLFIGGAFPASVVMLLLTLFYGLGIPWAIVALLTGWPVLRSRVAEMALISELLEDC